jgi:hypothetical protein
VAQLERALKAAQGRDRGPEPTIVVTVLGQKLVTRSGHVFANPQLEPIVVSTTTPVANPEQKAAALALWLSAPDAPPAYAFPASHLPRITDGCVDKELTPSPAQPATDHEDDL